MNEITKLKILFETEEFEVDIMKYPQDIKSFDNVTLTFGDMHGNALKLLHILVRFGILKLTNGEENYKKFVEIYIKTAEKLTEKDLNSFDEIIQCFEVNNKIGLRLIGDLLGDRGENDYYNLKILEKLYQAQNENAFQLRILHSNHDVDALRYFLSSEKEKELKKCIPEYQRRSQIGLSLLITKNLVKQNWVSQIATDIYTNCKTTKLIDYTLDDKGNITIFTHAPIGLESIKRVAKFLQVKFNYLTAMELAKTFDEINKTFVSSPEIFSSRINNPQENLVIFYFLWNRGDYFVPYKIEDISYNINWVHGHINKEFKFDSKSSTVTVNLDGINEVGDTEPVSFKAKVSGIDKNTLISYLTPEGRKNWKNQLNNYSEQDQKQIQWYLNECEQFILLPERKDEPIMIRTRGKILIFKYNRPLSDELFHAQTKGTPNRGKKRKKMVQSEHKPTSTVASSKLQ